MRAGDTSSFVARFRPDGHVTYVAIVPDGPTTTQTFNGADLKRALAWIDKQNGAGRNVYFTLNPPANPKLKRKPKKDDIGQMEGVWADIDPRDDQGLGLEAERERLSALAGELMALEMPPSLIIDSGNGIQAIWLAEQPVENCAEWRMWTEELCQRIEHALGAKGTHNVDRLLRVPGTTNFPSAKKRKLGRGKSEARLIHANMRRYSWRELEELAARLEDEPPTNSMPVRREPGPKEPLVADAEASLPDRAPEPASVEQIDQLLRDAPEVCAIWDRTAETSSWTDTSPSEWDMALVNKLVAHGLEDTEIWCFLAAYRLKHGADNDRKWQRRDYVQRTIRKARSGKLNGENGQEVWPDIVPVDPATGHLGKPAFPTDILPDKVRGFVEHVADGLQGPVEYTACGIIASCGALIGSEFALKPKRHDTWAEHTAIWSLNVADPGILEKTAHFKAVVNAVWQIQIQEKDKYHLELAAWEDRRDQAKRQKTKFDEPEPLKPIIIVNDTSREALADSMAGSPNTFAALDEISDIIRNMARYAGKGSDREFYLASWAVGPHAITRIVRGWQIVPKAYLSIYGFTQPATARECFALDKPDRPDDGFMDRFGLITFPDSDDYLEWQFRDEPPARDVHRDWHDVASAVYQHGYRDRMPWDDHAKAHVATLDDDAYQRFSTWLPAIKRWTRNKQNKQYHAYFGLVAKAPATVLRVAFVLHIMRVCCGEPVDPGKVDLESLDRAIRLYEVFLLPTYAVATGALTEIPELADARRVESWLRKGRPRDKLRPADILGQKLSPRLCNREAVLKVLAVMVDLGHLREDPDAKLWRGVPGSFLVNPKLWPKSA